MRHQNEQDHVIELSNRRCNIVEKYNGNNIDIHGILNVHLHSISNIILYYDSQIDRHTVDTRVSHFCAAAYRENGTRRW